MAIPKGPYDELKEAVDYLKMSKDKSKYYDVESGEERSWTHGTECPCPSCSKSRLRSVIDDVIKAKGAFAPASKKRRPSESFKPRRTDRHDWTSDIKLYGAKPEPTETDEGKCFGWQPDGQRLVRPIDEVDITNMCYSDIEDLLKQEEKEVYMHLTDKPMSPDMTRNDMAVMSVDQQRACLTLKVTYNPFFNERMKKSIESKYRNWNPTTKTWEFHPSMMKQIQSICGEFYKGVQIIGQKPVLGTKFEKLLSKLTKDDKQSIYRLMALKYHPDKGGDHETMSLLNEVFKQ